MTVTRRFDATARLLATLFATALVLAALPLGIASAQEDDEIEGEIIEEGPDAEAGLIASTRFRGDQRFATAALIVVDTWEQSDRAIIARHDEWPDALAGGYLAGVFEAPVLLISQNNIQDDTRLALEELEVSEVTILGGTQAISEENEQALEDLGYEVDRIGGATRFETAAMIADEGPVGEIDGQRTAFVATGIQFADALTAGPLAYDGNFPILLTPSQSLHPATEQALQDLDIERVLLLGGGNAISADVEEAIQDAIEGDEDSTTRLSGTTRIETAADVAGFAIAELGFAPFQHGWARGNEFADALTIGPRLGEVGGPLLLVPTPNLADSGEGTNEDLAADVGCFTASIDIAGGFAAVSESVEETLRGWLACPDEALLFSLEAEPESEERQEPIDLTATVWSNTGAALEGVEVTFDDVEVTPPAAVVEFREDDTEPWEDGPITVETDADGEATVQVTSDIPAQVVVEASHDRGDGVVLSETVEVSFVPAELEWTFEGMVMTSAEEHENGTARDEAPPFTGEADIYIDEDTGLVCWALVVDEPADPEQDLGSFEAFTEASGLPNSHIHEAPVGDAGPIVVFLGVVDDEDRTAVGCGVHEDLDELEDIVNNPTDYYVNLHTDLYPGGVVRTQLQP